MSFEAPSSRGFFLVGVPFLLSLLLLVAMPGAPSSVLAPSI